MSLTVLIPRKRPSFCPTLFWLQQGPFCATPMDSALWGLELIKPTDRASRPKLLLLLSVVLHWVRASVWEPASTAADYTFWHILDCTAILKSTCVHLQKTLMIHHRWRRPTFSILQTSFDFLTLTKNSETVEDTRRRIYQNEGKRHYWDKLHMCCTCSSAQLCGIRFIQDSSDSF